MKSKIAATVLAVAALLASRTAAAQSVRSDGTAMSVSFEPTRVTVANVTPGADVLFYAVGMVPDGFNVGQFRVSRVIPNAGADGRAALDVVSPGVPWKSVWLVVDLKSNEYVVASPPSFPVRQRALSPNAFKKGPLGALDGIAIKQSDEDLVYVHPGDGVYTLRAADGTRDFDGQANDQADGTTLVLLAKLHRIGGGSAHPSTLVPGGVLFIADVMHMEMTVVRLTTSVLNGGH